MADIAIRDIDEGVIEALRRRAANAGTSIEEEARRALSAALDLERDLAVARLAEIRRRNSASIAADTLVSLRIDRQRDDLGETNHG